MAVGYMSGETLTYTIEKLNHSIHELQSRVSECESKIARLNNQVYNIQLGRNLEFRDRIDELVLDFNDLKCQMVGEVAELRANLDAWIVNLNEKSDLEILEQNIDDEDKNQKNDYWFWNGDIWK